MLTTMGIKKAREDVVLRTALNTYEGKITHPALAASLRQNKKG
jgi:alanine dehydrogenase